ncbi:hypothetical protein DB891_05800 [Flavobacterium laiguense]|uniref:GSCFA domain-containing protein n=2 Tax=Flavobacterium laiguense TaxID=2169409 RepID=A0A2U1JZ32_9FLAO|nr:hypothetical protein DB891_05800 [Flavobacterium laiguense]
MYFSNQNETEKFPSHGIYFIGSSRVQRGIDHQLLNKKNKGDKAYNLGISGATFIHNITLAEHLILHCNAKKLFIELSPIIYSFHPVHESLNVNRSKIMKIYNLDYIEFYLFSKLNLRSSLKKIVTPSNNISKEYGYVFGNQNNYHKTKSFLKIEDLEKNWNSDVSKYFDIISNFNKIALKHNTKIYFFLPLTFRKEKEREIVSTIYQLLPNNQKVIYTEHFINSIHDPDYLFDENHFNYKGAKIMTSYFKEMYFTD